MKEGRGGWKKKSSMEIENHPLRDFFDTPVPLLRRGGPYPSTQALRPYHRGEGCSWLRYSFARVLVSPAEPLPYGLAMISYATELRLFYA